MRQVLHNIEAGRVSEELARCGLPPGQRLRVIVQSRDDEEPSMAALNAAGGAFAWLTDEPDLYDDRDLLEPNR
ncbi:MAG TPA: hypothetical protein VKR31_05005 [Rhizomicrobium sp.]|nr:hypothetical protein [Rhizomicrobium sp.]